MGSAMYGTSGCVSWALEIGRRLQIPYFTGHLFLVSGHFRPVSVNFDRFLGLIFPFGVHFWSRHMVYSHGGRHADVLPIKNEVVSRESVRNRCQEIGFGIINLHTSRADFTLRRTQLFAGLAPVRLDSDELRCYCSRN
jgi:hypothetical protein